MLLAWCFASARVSCLLPIVGGTAEDGGGDARGSTGDGRRFSRRAREREREGRETGGAESRGESVATLKGDEDGGRT